MSGEDSEGPLPRKWQLGKERLGRQELRRAIQKLLRLVAGRPLCRAVYWFARASAAANVTPWGQGGRRLHHRHLFSRSSGGWKPKIQVESGFVSSEASLLGDVQMAGHLHPALSRGLPAVPAPSAVSVRLLMRTPVGLTEGPP